MTSDIFFITATVCIFVLTCLLSVMILKIIKSLDDVNDVVVKTKNITSNISYFVATVTSFGGVFSPMVGTASRFFKRKKKNRQ